MAEVSIALRVSQNWLISSYIKFTFFFGLQDSRGLSRLDKLASLQRWDWG